MRRINLAILILVALLLVGGVASAVEIQTPLSGTVPASPAIKQPVVHQNAAMQRVTVQRVAQLRTLDWWEIDGIDRYMREHKDVGPAFRNWVEFDIKIDQSHVAKVYDKSGKLIGGKLNRSPNDYTADYQIFTQMLNRVDWYVNIPKQEWPTFCPPTSQGKLGFTPASLGEAEPQKPQRVRAEGFPAQSWNQPHVGASQVYGESWAAGWAHQSPEKHYDRPCPPPTPPDETCPPGGTPPPEQNPSGCNVLPTDGGSNIHVPHVPNPPGVR